MMEKNEQIERVAAPTPNNSEAPRRYVQDALEGRPVGTVVGNSYRVAAQTPAEGDDKVKDRLEELLGAFDTLYRYASDDGCPHAECHRYARPNRARIVLETWLVDYLTEGAATQENEGEKR